MSFEDYNRHMAQSARKTIQEHPELASKAPAAAAPVVPAPPPLPQQEKPKRQPGAWAAAASAYYHKEKERRPALTFKMALQELKRNAPQ
jgi:hypothetical protein